MHLAQQLAKHFRAAHFGGNWTGVHLKELLSDVTYEEANTKVESLNTILALAYHVSYYVGGIIEVFNNNPLSIRDKYSYEHPEISTAEMWQAMKDDIFKNAESSTNSLTQHIEAIPEDSIWKDFADPKYGSYFRNMSGLIEHTHYHMGQIALIKKLIRNKHV